jgi:tetratricopeptide (TPR) repeat protein
MERAKIVPSKAVVNACDAALVANGTLIALLSGVVREQSDTRNDRQVARRAHRSVAADTEQPVDPRSSAIDHSTDWDRLADQTRKTSRITPDVVSALEQITDRQRRLYHDLSSAEMLVQVRAHLGLLVTLLENHQRDSLRARIASAAAEAAGFAAWLWFDLGDVYRAQRCYDDAYAALDEACDQGLNAYIRGYQGLISAQTHGPQRALECFGEALSSGADLVSGTTLSWLTVLEAEALARTGQGAQAINAIARAEALLMDSDGVSDPWMYDFDLGCWAVHAGRCYLAADEPQRAADSLEEALRLLPASCDRRGARIRVDLARARIASGDGDEALRLGSAALTIFAARGSVAGVRDVRGLRREFIEAGLRSAAAALDDQAYALGHQAQ